MIFSFAVPISPTGSEENAHGNKENMVITHSLINIIFDKVVYD